MGAPIEGPLNPLVHHSAIILKGLRGSLIGSPLCRETQVSRTDNVRFLVWIESNYFPNLSSGVLLVGDPGTGKTLLAGAVAGEAGVPLLFASGPELEGDLAGDGAGKVRALFSECDDNTAGCSTTIS